MGGESAVEEVGAGMAWAGVGFGRDGGAAGGVSGPGEQAVGGTWAVGGVSGQGEEAVGGTWVVGGVSEQGEEVVGGTWVVGVVGASVLERDEEAEASGR